MPERVLVGRAAGRDGAKAAATAPLGHSAVPAVPSQHWPARGESTGRVVAAPGA